MYIHVRTVIVLVYITLPSVEFWQKCMYITAQPWSPPPLGVTPQRRAFAYPSQLTRTRPHFELLEEFRASVSTVPSSLPELPESDDETDTSSAAVSGLAC